MYYRIFLIFLSLTHLADSAASGGEFSQTSAPEEKSQLMSLIPVDVLRHTLPFMSEVDVLETFVRGPRFNGVFEKVQRFANLPTREAAIAYFVKVNRAEIRDVVEYDLFRERYLTALSQGRSPSGDYFSAGLMGVATRFLHCRRELMTMKGVKQSFRRSLENEALMSRCFKAIGLLATTELQQLDRSFSRLVDLTPLFILTNLERLQLNNNHVTDLRPLSTLTNLTCLGLEKNHVSNLLPLSSLTSLTELLLQENQATDLRPLSSLTSLNFLGLENTPVTDLGPLSTLPRLRTLRLRGVNADRAPVQSMVDLKIVE